MNRQNSNLNRSQSSLKFPWGTALLVLGAWASCSAPSHQAKSGPQERANPTGESAEIKPDADLYQLVWDDRDQYVHGAKTRFSVEPADALGPLDRLYLAVLDNGKPVFFAVVLVEDQGFVVETESWPKLGQSEERVLNLTAMRSIPDTGWSNPENLHEVAFGEFALEGAYGSMDSRWAATSRLRKVQVSESSGKTILKSGRIAATFDDATGALISYRKGSMEVLASPMRPNFWRPGSEAELAGPAAAVLARWKHAMDDSFTGVRTLDETGERVFLGYDLDLGLHEGAPRGTVQLAWFMSPDGSLELTYNLHPSTLPDGSPGEIPQVGLAFDLDRRFDQWSWYGRGPGPSTVDNLGQARWGQYEGQAGVAGLLGVRSGIREITIHDGERSGLFIRTSYAPMGEDGFEVCAHDKSWGELLGRGEDAATYGVSLDVVSVGDLSNERADRIQLFGNREYNYNLHLDIF